MWTFETARDDFGAVIEAAHSDAPQVVTRNGKAAAVVLSPEQYKELLEQARRHGGPFVQHLLAIPRGGEEIGRAMAKPRDVDF